MFSTEAIVLLSESCLFSPSIRSSAALAERCQIRLEPKGRLERLMTIQTLTPVAMEQTKMAAAAQQAKEIGEAQAQLLDLALAEQACLLNCCMVEALVAPPWRQRLNANACCSVSTAVKHRTSRPHHPGIHRS